ncbi:MAG: peptide ABC transporter substrate-binding protein [Bdellovibrionales bacterium]|nr:peptide ABC transporter substrate-binding protein [Bdellovibrionales bacterium]
MDCGRLVLISALVLCFGQGTAFCKTLNIHLPDSPATLDWNGMVTNPEAPIVSLLQEGLYGFQPETRKLIPRLAEGVKKSSDLKEYTFTIRKDAKWSDGRAVTAHDFVDSWLRLLSPQSTSLYLYYLNDVEGAKAYHQKEGMQAQSVGIRALDDRTLVVKLNRPVPDWEKIPTFWPFFPIRKDALEKFGDHFWRPGVLLSSGAFILESSEPGKRMTLKRNPHYAKGRSNIDQIEVHFGHDLKAAYERFESGFFPYLQFLPTEKLEKLKTSREVFQPPLYRNHMLVANAKKYPMTVRDFRTAVMKAIDVSGLAAGREISLLPSKSMIPTPLQGSEVPINQPADPVGAKRLLRASGVVLSKNFKIRILTRMGEPFQVIGKRIQNQIQNALGFEVELASLHPKEFSAYAGLNEFDLIMVYWNAKVPEPSDFLLPYGGTSTNRRLQFESAVFDREVELGILEGSQAAAMRHFVAAQKEFLLRERVLLPLVDEKTTVLRSPKIKNLYFDFMGFPVLKDVVLTD